MSAVMHLDKNELPDGSMETQCGYMLGPYEGADRDAPLCPDCQVAAGWPYDLRVHY